MPELTYTILESWPMLKDDLGEFVSDTDAWVISRLQEAYELKDWDNVSKIIDIMEMLHSVSHSH